jgi:SAM-dependent methyltransferase
MPKAAKILELGCASGELLKDLLAAGYSNLDFVDIDDYLDYDEVKSLAKLKKIDLNKDSLPYTDNSFDICLAIAIFEHLENPWLFEREVSRVLKKSGRLLLALPHNFNILDGMQFLFTGNLSGYGPDNNHITLQTRDVFNKCWLKDFKIEKGIYSPGFVKIFGMKFSLPNHKFVNKLFGRKALYILEKR